MVIEDGSMEGDSVFKVRKAFYLRTNRKLFLVRKGMTVRVTALTGKEYFPVHLVPAGLQQRKGK